ncbi:hypothetical protein ACFLYK_01805 [Candidatus Cloacimonadota bacterium]
MNEYSTELCFRFADEYKLLDLHKPRISLRYDPGKILRYHITSIDNLHEIDAELLIEKFVGGGFAGQVYKVKLISTTGDIDELSDLKVGASYALKILVPPSGFSLFFRNLIYWLGFGGPFQPQVNPAAARYGAIWQKFIRLAAGKRFGDYNCVVDIFGLFIDSEIGSCGEISEWIEGRTWWLEVNDRLKFPFWKKKKRFPPDDYGSPEFQAKHAFMKEFVNLLHQMGAPEFARQYEWSTMKSQPNCLKRNSTLHSPREGLVAVDFRAGLALLPYLPMSPGDFKLILKGILRGSLVQFDRGNIPKLKQFISRNLPLSDEVDYLLSELEVNSTFYHNSIPDITHNHLKLIFSRKLWSGILHSSRIGWKIRNLIDPATERKLSQTKVLMILFYIASLIPIIGNIFIRISGMKNWRDHYRDCLSSPSYFRKAFNGTRLLRLIKWHRTERITEKTALKINTSSFTFILHLILSILPVGMHRFLTDKSYFDDKLYRIFIRPLKLYFDQNLRVEWLQEMVDEGKNKHMLSDDDASTILTQLDEPFIQKYLKSLAVHVCTIPITQIVSVFLALLYVITHPEMPRTQAWGIGVGIIALFQVIPISPGSLVRGLYVVYLVIKEKNFKDYNIAVFLGFFKYVGYLAFPIQMTYKYPALARFMAGHWATEAVHIIPVFGEKGALLEHWIFDLFYNLPLTIRRQMTERAELRKNLKSGYWHIPFVILVICGLFYFTDIIILERSGQLPDVRSIWWLTVIISLITGSLLNLGYKGMNFGRRLSSSIFSGIALSTIYTILSFQNGFQGNIIIEFAWRFFIVVIFTIIGTLFSEITYGEN